MSYNYKLQLSHYLSWCGTYCTGLYKHPICRKVQRYLTITATCGPFANSSHKVGTIELYTMALYAVALQLSINWN